MAKMYVTEFSALSLVPNAAGPLPNVMGPCANTPPRVEQTPVAIGVGSLQSAAFGLSSKIVRVHVDAICSIAFGVDPIATANNMRMVAGQTEYFGIAPGYKVAVITNT